MRNAHIMRIAGYMALCSMSGCTNTDVQRGQVTEEIDVASRVHSIHRVERCRSGALATGESAYIVREAISADGVSHLPPMIDSGVWLYAAWIGYLGQLLCLDEDKLPIAHIEVALHNSRITVVTSLFSKPLQPLNIGDRYVLAAPARREDLGFDLIAQDLVQILYDHLKIHDPARVAELEAHLKEFGDISIDDAIRGDIEKTDMTRGIR